MTTSGPPKELLPATSSNASSVASKVRKASRPTVKPSSARIQPAEERRTNGIQSIPMATGMTPT